MANQHENAQSEDSSNVKDELSGLQQRMAELESTLQGVLHEKQIQEADFAQKRAKFKEIFLQREDELIKEAENVRKERDKAEADLNDVKSIAVLAEQSYKEEVDDVRRLWKTEVGSMQQIMTNAVALTTEETAVTYQKERETLLFANEQLTRELQELQGLIVDRNHAGAPGVGIKPESGLLTNMTRSIRSWSNTTSTIKDENKTDVQLTDEDLENSMLKDEQSMSVNSKRTWPKLSNAKARAGQKLGALRRSSSMNVKAQKDAELLRAVVLPLEEEMEALKAKLREADGKRKVLEGKLRKAHLDALGGITTIDKAQSPATPPEGVYEDQSNLDEKMKELNHVLEAEKSSRSDLELYVAVLNKQKTVMQDDGDSLHKELKDVCRLLEVEKQEHQQLKNTWHMANDQFLESQRLQMMDMRRMESVLTEEQQRQIMEVQRKDHEREEQEKRVRELTERREKIAKEQEEKRAQQAEQEKSLRKSSDPQDIPSVPGKHTTISESPITSGSSSSATKISPHSTGIANIDPDDLLQFESCGPSQSTCIDGAPLHRSVSEITAHSFADSAVQGMDGESTSITSNFSLTEAQEKAISSDTPETTEIKSVLASARSKTEVFPSLAGKRVVSETEWIRVMEEVKNAREKLGRPCDMCSNYELQLQTVQGKEQEYKDLTLGFKQDLEQEKVKVGLEQRLRSELEESLKNAAEDAQSQIRTATSKNQESEKFVTDLRQSFLRTQNEIHDQLSVLLTTREQIYQEVQRLQKENESLSAKRTLHTSIVRSEDFELPITVEDLQRLCLKYREDIITIKVNSEHTDESLRNENGFLKDQLQAEQHTKNTLEETYQMELDEYKEELIMLRSVKDEYEHEKRTREEYESRIGEMTESQKNTITQHQEAIQALKTEIETLQTIKAKLEQELRECKNKLQSLQYDLDNSEVVQRDFVRLSQSLQVQLENIRQKDNEVRWLHEDDADKCNSCKSPFGSNKKKKHHCMHCGKVYCPDCLTKHVESGPRGRRMPVCDICHTLLVNESAPYFSKEAPMNT